MARDTAGETIDGANRRTVRFRSKKSAWSSPQVVAVTDDVTGGGVGSYEGSRLFLGILGETGTWAMISDDGECQK